MIFMRDDQRQNIKMFPSKGRNKSIVSPKDRDPTPLKANDLLSTSNLVRRSASSSLDGSNPNVADQSQRSQGHAQQRVINNHGKRPVLPSAALAPELSFHGNRSEHVVSSTYHQVVDSDSRSSVNSQSTTRGAHSSSVYLPGDRVVFAESLSSPGIPIVYRTTEERSANPDRLNLDRRRLSACPVLEGEDQLRLLNYQHNLITKIQHLSGLKRLIFLDLYDNQIEEISGLNSLRSLRVLMLGKNRIRRIENLDSLTKLDVLDLHGNEILHIENLNHLTELRVLNLAGNLIQQVNNLSGLDALTELNLRRNHIHCVNDVDVLPNLQRLFLSFNEITCFEEIQCLADSQSITELSLDGNTFSQESHYKQIVLRYMQQLRQLDMKRVSEDERRIATVMARKEEDKRRESNKIAVMKERRRLAIGNARRQWEVMQGSLMCRTNNIVRNSAPREYLANHVGNVPNSEIHANSEDDKPDSESSRSSSRLSRPTSAKSTLSEKDWSAGGSGVKTNRAASRTSSVSVTTDKDKIVINGPSSSTGSLTVDFLSELDGDTLHLYGSGSLDAFDKNWGIQAAGAVTTINFKFIDYDEIVKVLHKIRVRFPNVHTLFFNSTNICHLSQLNGLSALRRLDNIVIDNDGNPITHFMLWKTYLIFRLAHFSLKKINDVEVSATDIVNAEKFFGTLAHITTSQLPQARLLALLGDKKKQLLNEDKKKSGIEGKLTDRGTESVGRAGLVYNTPDTVNSKTQEQNVRQKFVRNYIKELTYDAMQTNQKLHALQNLWPQIFTEMIHTAVLDMWDLNSYMKKALDDLEKS